MNWPHGDCDDEGDLPGLDFHYSRPVSVLVFLESNRNFRSKASLQYLNIGVLNNILYKYMGCILPTSMSKSFHTKHFEISFVGRTEAIEAGGKSHSR